MLCRFSRVRLFETPFYCSPPGSSVHRVLQARILEWVAMPSSRGSSGPGIKLTSFTSPALAGGFFTTGATWEAAVLQVDLFSLHFTLLYVSGITFFFFLNKMKFCGNPSTLSKSVGTIFHHLFIQCLVSVLVILTIFPAFPSLLCLVQWSVIFDVTTVTLQVQMMVTSFSSSIAKSCPPLCDPVNCSTPGLPVPHCLLEFAQVHVHLNRWYYATILSCLPRLLLSTIFKQ